MAPRLVFLLSWLLASGTNAAGQDVPPSPVAVPDAVPAVPAPPAGPVPEPDEGKPPVTVILGKNGIDLQSADGRYGLHLWFRAQLRFSTPFDSDPRSPLDFEAPAETSIDLRRIRIKLDGHAYRPWLNYSFEYDFKSRLLDIQLTLSRYPWLQLRAGQWKANYNRERVDSSGRQQFADRSIVNREFTLDRQPGAMLFGHLLPGRRADSWYYLGLFNGNGPNASNDDSSLMWLARYQWNFLGRDLPFSQGDVRIREKPAGSIAYAAVGNRGLYTRYSTEGGGQLDGFEPGTAGRYGLAQGVVELAFHYRGLSIQQELHRKEVTDHPTGQVTKLEGAYAQVGFFPWALSRTLPRPLELAVRWAFVDPDRSLPDDRRRELTMGANWFFSGHDNKLTADLSRLDLEQATAPTLRDHRFRLQWDISF